MVYALLICRSLTYAQRTAAVLERSGISASVLRTPKRIAVTGCSYSVKISVSRREEVRDLLLRENLLPKSVVYARENGIYEEVPL